MCLEDLRMGRKKYTRVDRVVLDTTANQQIVAASPDLVHLRISTDATQCYVGPGEVLVDASGGMLLDPQKPDLDIDVETHGNIVSGRWDGCSVLASTIVTVIETFYKDTGAV